MQLNINENGKAKSKLDVADAIFAAEYNEALVHQVVTAQLAGARAGTKAQKNRSEKRGGGRKPWKQKGTGRARAGSIRSPIWRGGAKTFAAKPRDFSQKVNKKMFRGAMCSMLSELIREERLVVINEMELTEPKTKQLVGKLAENGIQDALIITDQPSENLLLASRNLPNIGLIDAQGVDPLALISFKGAVITVPALKQLEERLS